jgi:FKBP-type peptidyl-prolyl cis-trans isomerase FkpA
MRSRFALIFFVTVAALSFGTAYTKDTKKSSSTKKPSTTAKEKAQAKEDPKKQTPAAANGLKIEDIKVGDGAEATSGKTVEVHYTGWLLDGKEFDSSVPSGRPFSFKLGAQSVIKGWDEGIKGMKVHGKRKLTIPPEMAYGAQGAGSAIPPNATLKFDVELLSVK